MVSDAISTPLKVFAPKEAFLSVFFLSGLDTGQSTVGGAEGSSVTVLFLFSPARCLSGTQAEFKTMAL